MVDKRAYPTSGHVVILAGGAGCFSGDTLVACQDGHKRIQDIQEGDTVLTMNEDSGLNEYQPVEELVEFGISHGKRLVELAFDNGEVVVCTEDHEFLIDGEWIEAKDIPITT